MAVISAGSLAINIGLADERSSSPAIFSAQSLQVYQVLTWKISAEYDSQKIRLWALRQSRTQRRPRDSPTFLDDVVRQAPSLSIPVKTHLTEVSEELQGLELRLTAWIIRMARPNKGHALSPLLPSSASLKVSS